MKINDGKGNTISASKDQELLSKAGWRIVEIKKKGAFKSILWIDPLPNGNVREDGKAFHSVHSQAFALQLMRERKQMAKQAAKQN